MNKIKKIIPEKSCSIIKTAETKEPFCCKKIMRKTKARMQRVRKSL